MTALSSPAASPLRRRARLLRPALACAAALALALTATACDDSSSPGGTAGSAATRAVDTAHGKVTVPAHPLRIVSVHSWSTESLYDLGLQPVGVENSGANYVPPRYLARWKSAAKVTTGADLDYEKIASLKPDLIVGVDVPYLSKAYKRLSAIAPTAFASFKETAAWSAYPDATARFVNRTTQLDRLKQKYADRIAAVRKAEGAKLSGNRWAVIQGGFDSGNYWIYSPASPVGDILAKLGVRFAPATASVAAGSTRSVSYERADLLKDADYVVYYTNNDGSPANNIQKLFDLRSFKELPAAKNHRVVGTADFLPGSYSDALGVVDTIADALAKQSG
ncbi:MULTISPECIES: ABC transporter substrate-binding protein [unclassified Streptomyces]|uniref:ABC transporter substrate-binding protein n=1 Tax=unclassified Streptomyces TaxID=2593676 RepID=UPI00035C7A55|nr:MULTISPECIES: ABC transporter substrate-binding protein [unclassified Streptomyces]